MSESNHILKALRFSSEVRTNFSSAPQQQKEIQRSFESLDFRGFYSLQLIVSETAEVRKLITKKGTLEILILLNASTNPLRHKQITQPLKRFSTKTLSNRLKELQKNALLERQRYKEMPLRVEYRLSIKGQELVRSIISMLQLMRTWANAA